MKSIFLAIVSLSLLEGATAVVLNAHHGHAHKHKARQIEVAKVQHEKRKIVTEIVYETVTAPGVVIYVDGSGNPISTSFGPEATAAAAESPAPVAIEADALTEERAPAASTPTPEPAVPVEAETPEPPVEVEVEEPVPAAPASEPIPETPENTEQAPVQDTVPEQETPDTPAPVSGIDFPLGIAYTPYTEGPCKSAEAILSDFQRFSDFGLVRIYGVDCNQVANSVAAASATNKKLLLGVFDLNNADGAVQTIISEAGDFSVVAAVAIGNEEVHKGRDVGSVVNAVNTARAQLRAAGYNGPVGTADVFSSVLNNKALCGASDVAMINCHAFFTPTVSSDQAGKYVSDRVEEIRQLCGSEKRVLVTESGWPSAGDANGAAIASLQDQRMAITSLREAFPNGDLVLHSAFDDVWKQDFGGSFNAEKHWGIMQ